MDVVFQTQQRQEISNLFAKIFEILLIIFGKNVIFLVFFSQILQSLEPETCPIKLTNEMVDHMLSIVF